MPSEKYETAAEEASETPYQQGLESTGQRIDDQEHATAEKPGTFDAELYAELSTDSCKD